MKYVVEEDSHGRLFLKEEDYGYIAEVLPPYVNPFAERNRGIRLAPLNKGVDMTERELLDALLAVFREAM